MVQTGLFNHWLPQSTVDNVLLPNSNVHFEYVGVFQTNTVTRRWHYLDVPRPRIERKTFTLPAPAAPAA